MGRRPRSNAVLGFAALAGGCLGGPVTAHAFDCAKASLGVDYVICADQRLVAAIDDMGRVWRRIKAATPADQFAPLLADQREWVKTYGPSCGLPAKGPPDARRIAEAAPCISARVGERLAYLKGVEAGAAASDAANREWTRGFAQGTVEAGVRNAAGGAFTISCPFGQLETAPMMAFKASSGDERGETGAPAFTLLVDGNTPILSVNTGGDQQSFTWSPLNDSEFAVMETVIERVRTASRFAVELPNSGRREEFSTRNAPEALKGVLNGCAPTDAAMAEAPLPVAAPAPPAPAPPAPATPPAAAFGITQLAAIIETSQTNAARFARDHKGKSFGARLAFEALEDGFFGQRLLTASAGGLSVTCVGRSDLANAAIDWRVGDVITVSGTINDTVLGVLMLDPCTASK